MKTFDIIAITITLVFLMIAGFTLSLKIMIQENRKKRVKDWKIGDLVYTKNGNSFSLAGWSLKAFYITNPDPNVGTQKVSWSHFDFNKSVIWRQNYNECKSFMKTEPGFKGELVFNDECLTEMIDGKPIMIFTETECQVFLKRMLVEEDYRKVALIKKRLEAFR